MPADGSADLAAILTGGSRERREALNRRIQTLLAALTVPVSTADGQGPLTVLEAALRAGGGNEAWLALAVITGRLPDSAQVRHLARATRLDGPLPALFAALCEAGQLEAAYWPDVEVATEMVLVDIHDTARNRFPTGIQRVARQTARHWSQQQEVTLVGWTDSFTAYRRLSAVEADAALAGYRDTSQVGVSPDTGILVPWRCTLLVPELVAELQQAPRYQAVAMFSKCTTGLVGFDCVPLTASETTAEGMSGGFARYLAAAAHVDRIATISEASAMEYRGWRAMLSGAGLAGPDIRSVPLPVEAPTPTDAALAEASALLGAGPLPMVLSVGSHEPRKDHLTLLHAAEVLWREGLHFSLVFVGGNSWNSAAFEAHVATLQAARRPLQTIRGLPDDLLWAAYRLAYCTVFASLHEGFGLPVAESLASGTPVITSNFGSMREIASQGGALLVDPRHDQSLIDALRRLLNDRPLRDRLAGEAATIPLRSWDQYAHEAWAYLVHGEAPPVLA